MKKTQATPATRNASPAAPAPIALSAFILDEEKIDKTASGFEIVLDRLDAADNKPASFRASLSIVADCLPFYLARVGGRWCLEFGLGNEYPASGPVLAVEVGEGCALSFEEAAALVCGG